MEPEPMAVGPPATLLLKMTIPSPPAFSSGWASWESANADSRLTLIRRWNSACRPGRRGAGEAGTLRVAEPGRPHSSCSQTAAAAAAAPNTAYLRKVHRCMTNIGANIVEQNVQLALEGLRHRIQ